MMNIMKGKSKKLPVITNGATRRVCWMSVEPKLVAKEMFVSVSAIDGACTE